MRLDDWQRVIADPNLHHVFLWSQIHHIGEIERDADKTPVGRHLLYVYQIVRYSKFGSDFQILAAALLHDVLKDCRNKGGRLQRSAAIVERFGGMTAYYVKELTDMADKGNLRTMTEPAKIIAIAEQAANLIAFVSLRPTPEWSAEKHLAECKQARRIASACKGVDPNLDRFFTDLHKDVVEMLKRRQAENGKEAMADIDVALAFHALNAQKRRAA